VEAGAEEEVDAEDVVADVELRVVSVGVAVTVVTDCSAAALFAKTLPPQPATPARSTVPSAPAVSHATLPGPLRTLLDSPRSTVLPPPFSRHDSRNNIDR
jgi:hypothetical protein